MVWILATGSWNDAGVWDDSDVWQDGGALGTVYLDPAQLGPTIGLSNANLTATQTAAATGNTRATAHHNSGSYYHEFTVDVTGNMKVGICSADLPLTEYLGEDPTVSIGIDDSGGWIGASGTTTAPALIAAHTYGMATTIDGAGGAAAWCKDITAGGYWNADASANPITGIGGALFSEPRRRLVSPVRRWPMLSATAGTNQNQENTYNYSARGSGASYAKRLSAGRLQLPVTNIAAGSGFTAAQIRSTHYPTAKASSAKVLLLLAGVNQGSSQAQDIADVTYMATDWAASAADRVVFVYDEMPVDTAAGWDATKKTRHVRCAMQSGRWMIRANGIYVVPSWQCTTGGDDGDTPLADFYADWLDGIAATQPDGVHPAIKGAFLLGKMLQPFIESALPAFNPYSGETFATGTARDGANFAGATGNAISVAGLNQLNTASSRMVVDGATTWAELTINTTALVSCNPSASTITGTGITAGSSTVSSIIKVKLHAGLTNVASIQLKQIKQSALALGTNAGEDFQHQGSAYEIGEIPVTEDVYLTMQTPPVLVAADATQARWQINFGCERVGAANQTMVGLVSVAYGGMIIE